MNGKIAITLKEDKESVSIVVIDNGIGMDKNELMEIKKPFFTTKDKGTGLGVYLSNQIVEAHNGEIIYESEKYKGTKTIIKLPKM